MLLDVQPTVALAFLAGLVSFLSPCVFPLMPAYIAFLGGRAGQDAEPPVVPATGGGDIAVEGRVGSADAGAGRRAAGAAPPAVAGTADAAGASLAAVDGGGAAVAVAAPASARARAAGASTAVAVRRAPLLANGAAFVAGFSLVFVALFYVLSALEVPLVARYHHWLSVGAGVVVVLLALHVMGVFRFAPLMRDIHLPRPVRGTGMGSSLLLGITFAAGWTPCIGPLLGAVLQVATLQHSFSGLPYMLVYCAGLGVPFLAVAALTDRLQGPIRALNRHMGVVNLVAGCLLLVFGALLIADRFTFFSQLAPQSPFDL